MAGASALALLAGCGGDEGGDAGPTITGSQAVLLSCDGSDECSELSEECLDDPKCLARECAESGDCKFDPETCAESGGCVPTILPGRPTAFGTRDEFRMCFDLRVQLSSEEPVGESTPTLTGATETGEADTSGSGEAGAISSVECSGPSYPLRGLDLSGIEDELEVADDGQLVWFQEGSPLLVTFADGEFSVSEQP